MPASRFTRRDFLKLAGGTMLSAGLLGVGGWDYSRQVEPLWVEITYTRLTLPHLAKVFDGYRLVQISDIHMDDWMTTEHLQKTVLQVNRQQPDLIVLTGDYFTYDIERFVDILTPILAGLHARDGVLAVLGNHDHWTNPRLVREMLAQSGARLLDNRHYSLQRGRDSLQIAGVDDMMVGLDNLDWVLERLPAAGAAILLAHEPDLADQTAASRRFDLQLSGHSHGGQVVLPVIGPPVLPAYAHKYPSGLYHVGEMIQYTNRGLGMVEPRVRFNCRPEISVFDLQSSQANL